MATIPTWSPPRRRPGGVTAVAVIACVLGGIGLLAGLWMILWAVLGVQGRTNMFVQPGMTAEQRAAQEGMMADMRIVAQRRMPFSIAANCLAVVTSAGMLFWGIAALRDREAGRKWLVVFMLASILSEVVWVLNMIPMQLETGAVTQRWMPKMLAGSTPEEKRMPKDAEHFVVVGTKFAVYFGIAIWTGWSVAKALFYFFGARYLRRPHVLAYYEPVAADVVPLA